MKEKLYCYVDETGQDTMGKLFIVVAIVVDNERDDLTIELEKIERQTKKTKIKWLKTKRLIKADYLNSVLSLKKLKGKLYYQIFRESKIYQDLTCLVIAKAINRYVAEKKIKSYQASIFIDGLNKTSENKISKLLRDLGIKTRKVKGVRDDANAIIRLADSLAGMVREIDQGKNDFKKFKKTIKELD